MNPRYSEDRFLSLGKPNRADMRSFLTRYVCAANRSFELSAAFITLSSEQTCDAFWQACLLTHSLTQPSRIGLRDEAAVYYVILNVCLLPPGTIDLLKGHFPSIDLCDSLLSMSRPVVLRGYRYSVYNRITRVALHEKGILYQTEEIDPFADCVPEHSMQRQPFGRVPVLSHGMFGVYETAAIGRYIDAAFDGPRLTPLDVERLTRLAQTVSIIDSYGYRPMVRQVFAHRVFRPAVGETSDEAEWPATDRSDTSKPTK